MPGAAAPIAMVPPSEKTLTRGNMIFTVTWWIRRHRYGTAEETAQTELGEPAARLGIKKQDRFQIEMHLNMIAVVKFLHAGNGEK